MKIAKILEKHTHRGGIADAFRIIWPLMLSNSVNAIMQFTDRVFLSNYSITATQASVPAGTLSFLLPCLMMMTVSYSGTFVAQYFGAGKRLQCAHAFMQGLWLLVVTIPLTLALIPLGHWIISISGHAAEVMALEKVYFDIMMIGSTILPMSAALTGYFTGRGKTKLVMQVSIFGSCVNILLDWMMIYGKCGFPELGMAGAAWATVISFITTMSIFAFIAFREPVFRGKRGRAVCRFDYPLAAKIVRYGIPAGVHILLDMLTFTFFVFVTGNKEIIDAMSFSASNICFNINHLVFAPLMGISLGASTLVGNYLGAKDIVSAKRTGWSAMYIGWAYMLLILLLLAVFFRPCVLVFLPENATFDLESFIRLSRILLVLMASWCMFDVMSFGAGGALKGAGDTKFVMMAGVVMSLFFWIPLVLLVKRYCPNIIYFWATMPAYISILGLVILWRWIRGKWAEVKLVE